MCNWSPKHAHSGPNMLVQGHLLSMIPPYFAIFDLRIGFYGSKTLTYTFWYPLWKLFQFQQLFCHQLLWYTSKEDASIGHLLALFIIFFSSRVFLSVCHWFELDISPHLVLLASMRKTLPRTMKMSPRIRERKKATTIRNNGILFGGSYLSLMAT